MPKSSSDAAYLIGRQFFDESYTRSASATATVTFSQSGLADGYGALACTNEFTVTMTGTGDLILRGTGQSTMSFTVSVAMPIVVDIEGQGSFIFSGQGDWAAILEGSGNASISLSGELKKRVGVRQVAITKKYWK
jgi:hypothetical protein